MYWIGFTNKAKKDQKLLKRSELDLNVKELIDVIRENPYQIPPMYEKLTGNLRGLYSRRITYQHRLVYEVFEEPFSENGIEYSGYISIVSMWSHYEF